MKLQLDTSSKTIKLEHSVNLGELQEILDRILPNNEWKEYKLEPCIIQNWSSPIVIDRYVQRPIPWWQRVTYQYGSINNKSTYCLEV